jgi:hypothetical protein
MTPISEIPICSQEPWNPSFNKRSCDRLSVRDQGPKQKPALAEAGRASLGRNVQKNAAPVLPERERAGCVVSHVSLPPRCASEHHLTRRRALPLWIETLRPAGLEPTGRLVGEEGSRSQNQGIEIPFEHVGSKPHAQNRMEA